MELKLTVGFQGLITNIPEFEYFLTQMKNSLIWFYLNL